MEIEISNFRCIQNLRLQLTNESYLLKGETGKGKSTILDSIEWCLFGGSGASPFQIKEKKSDYTKVKLTFEGFSVTRSKSPEKIQVEKGKEVFKDSEALFFIKKKFGTRIYWKSCSYLKQDTRNFLLFSSASEKMDILKEIVFGTEDEMTPDKYIEKINLYVKDLDKNLISNESSCGMLNKIIQEEDLKEEVEMCDEKWFTRETGIRNKIDYLERKLKETEELKICQRELDEIKKKKKNYLPLTKRDVQRWKEYTSSVSELKDLSYTEESETLDSLSKKKILLEKDYQIMLIESKKCYKIGIKYEQEVIKSQTEVFQKLIERDRDYQEYIKAVKNYKKIEEKINMTREKLNKIKWVDDFESICNKLNLSNETSEYLVREELKELRREHYTCPECQSRVFLEAGELKKSRDLVLDQEEIETMWKQLAFIKIQKEEERNLLKEIQSLEEVLVALVLPEKVEQVLSDIDLTKINLETLKRIQFKDINPQEIKDLERRIENCKKYLLAKELKLKIKVNETPLILNLQQVEDIDSYYLEYLQLCKEKERLEDKIKNLVIDDDEPNLKSKINKLNKLLQKVVESSRYRKVIRWKEKIKTLKSEREELEKKKEASVKIKSLVEETSSNTFTSLIKNFNLLVNEISSELFDDIWIELEMFKKLKSSGKIKSKFNLKLVINGKEYENLNCLSGGEKDRVSISLTLALNCISSSGIIILDECMSSLDEEMRWKCLNLIKKYTKDKIVISVCHSTIEGYYDKVLTI